MWGLTSMTIPTARAFAPLCAVAVAALCLAVSFGGVAEAKKKPKEPVIVAVQPPPPEPEIPAPTPVLAHYVVDTAGAYATYMRTATGIGAKFADGPSVTSALLIGVHSEKRQLQQGMVAYAAIVALQDPAFVSAVRGYATHASTRDAMLRYILADPNYVLAIAGHETAAGLVVATLNAQAIQLETAGEAVRKSSYSIQLKSPWSKKPAPNQAAILEQVKLLSSSAITPADDLKAQLMGASDGSAALVLAGSPALGPQSQAVVRGLALAALAVLGKAGDEDMAYVMPLLVNDGDGFCFNMSKLNLYQCLSVAKPYYEDVYCLGLHAMADTGRCVKGALEPPDADPRLAATLVTAVTPVSTAPNLNGAVSTPGGSIAQ